MSSSKFSQKPNVKISFKPVAPFDLYYHMTYMSAIAAAGVTRAKMFELAAESSSEAAVYFEAINVLVNEFRFSYAEACRMVGTKAKSDNIRSLLLRLSDALRSGEPLPEFLGREAEVQGKAYENKYDRDLEGLKQWSNAFTSISISVALIVIIQVISSMIYSMDTTMMLMLVGTGLVMAGFGTYIIWRSAPKEVMAMKPAEGSAAQQHAMRMFRMLFPISIAVAGFLSLTSLNVGYVLIVLGAILTPVGYLSLRSDKQIIKKDEEFSTFLRSTGSMATSSGTTLNQSLTKIDIASFPALETDIERLTTRLQALVEPRLCWEKFGSETGSRLISDTTDIFYRAINIGGEPERVGYWCSLFAAKTSQLRAKRRLIIGTFAGLSSVMQAIVAGLMVFVLSIVQSFAVMVQDLLPESTRATASGQSQMSIGMAQFTAEELQFLSNLTFVMVLVMAAITAAAIILGDGGYRLKFMFYLAITILISGVCYIFVPPLVAGILTM